MRVEEGDLFFVHGLGWPQIEAIGGVGTRRAQS